MRKLKFGMLACLTTVAVAGYSPTFATEYPEMTIRLAHAFPESWVQSGQVDKWFAEEIGRRSDGKIKVRIFWSGSLARPKEIFDAVGKGGLAMGADAHGYYGTDLPVSSMTNALTGTLSWDSARQSSQINREMFDMFPAMQEEWKELGIWPLYFNANSSFRIVCTSSIKSVEDIKDKKIRMFSAYHPTLWKSLGAVGVNVLPSEIYEGLQRGRLDCGFYTYSLMKAAKIYEQAKYISSANFGSAVTWPVVVNYDTYFNKWPESVRKLVAEVAREAELRSVEVETKADLESLEFMKTHGATLVEFPVQEQEKLEEKVPDFIDVWQTEAQSAAHGDAAKAIAEYSKKRRAELAP
ncbi:MAG: TRAP transporter substrate-binding protein DctP [Pusillimonas sp.]